MNRAQKRLWLGPRGCPERFLALFLSPSTIFRCFCFATISHIVAAEVREPDLVVTPQSASALAVRVSPKQPLPPTRWKRKRDTGMKNVFVRPSGKYAAEPASALAVLVSPKQPLPPSNRKRKRGTGMKNIVKHGGKYLKYAAGVSFDGMTISTRVCDLSTAVEFLMVLTSIKQKFLCAGAESFEERAREAVVSACDEHGKSELEMGLRFCFCLTARSFIGKYQLTPGAEYPKAGLFQSKHVSVECS